jgi:hypothetical protein
MRAGLGLTVIAAIAPYVDRATTRLLADHIRAGYPDYTQIRVDSAVDLYVALLSVIGALGAAAWLWAMWSVKAGTGWARPVATVLLALGTGVGLVGLLTTDTSGDTGLPPALGWMGLAPCLAGLVAVGLMWWNGRPETASGPSAPRHT